MNTSTHQQRYICGAGILPASKNSGAGILPASKNSGAGILPAASPFSTPLKKNHVSVKSRQILPVLLLAITGLGLIGSATGVNAQFPPSQTIPVPAPATTAETYTLGAGDRIGIDIFNVPEYSGENGQHQVSLDGTLNLPLIGLVTVQGMTLEQATELLKQRYAEYLQRPLISLKLLATRPLQVAVAGEVQRPGSYLLTSGTANNNSMMAAEASPSLRLPTITRVLQMAGGVTPSADVRQVKIRRQQGQFGEQVINLDLWELLQTGDLHQDITLRDGDTIYIPTVTDLNPTESSQLVAANFASSASRPINVGVVGEVNRPGTHTLSVEMPSTAEASGSGEMPLPQNLGVLTVTKAIKAAGGITFLADIRKIEVRRLTRTGTEQVIAVDLWQLLQNGDLSQDVLLQQGDTVVVPKAENTADSEASEDAVIASFAPDTVKISVVGEVGSPGPVNVPPRTSLNQAIVTAGGLIQGRSSSKSVDLIRLNPNGTVSRRTIPLNLSAEVNEETNPTLRNNDVILVGRSGGAAFRDGVGTVLGTLNPVSNVLGLLRFVNIFN